MDPSLLKLILISLGVSSGPAVEEPYAQTHQHIVQTRQAPAAAQASDRAQLRLRRTISITHVDITEEEEQDVVGKTNCSSPVSRLNSKL